MLPDMEILDGTVILDGIIPFGMNRSISLLELEILLITRLALKRSILGKPEMVPWRSALVSFRPCTWNSSIRRSDTLPVIRVLIYQVAPGYANAGDCLSWGAKVSTSLTSTLL